MKLKPLLDRVLVKRLEELEQKKGGIIIPDTAKEKPMEGKVIAVGPGKVNDKGQRVPPEVKTGEIVMYKEYGGTEIKIQGDKYMLLDGDDLLGVFE